MTILSIRAIYEAARAAGFTPQQAVTWTSIALAESGGRTGALNDRGEHSMGLWQINVAGSVRTNRWGDLNDPVVNARAAYDVSRHGLDMRPWTTTHDANKGTAHDYRRYLGRVEAEIGVNGDGRGVHGYGSPLPPPLPEGLDPTAAHSYDAIDAGRSISAFTDPSDAMGLDHDADSDHDGLTDAFEKLAGTSSQSADTDGDGLTDSYEALVSHTDPLSADTDKDHLSDAYELATGTDPGHLPGIAAVSGAGPFAENIRHGVVDTDKDGLSDHTEHLIGTDASSADTDGDGLPDAMEASLGTDPTRLDSDHDGLSDGIELRYHTDPLHSGGGMPRGAAATPDTTSAAPWTLESAAAALATEHAAQADLSFDAAARPDSQALGAPDGETARGSALGTFLEAAVAQKGDSYVYGAEARLSDPDPRAFDCSELTQWAAHRAGVTIPDGAEAQYLQLKKEGLLVPVDQALTTPGALLFYFSREPTASLPSGQAHVAISLGDGRTIEARGRAYGVGEFSARHRFNYAGVIPGISDGAGLQANHEAQSASSAATVLDAGPEGSGPDASGFAIDDGRPVTSASGLMLGSATNGSGDSDADSDHDGLTDAFEKLAGTSSQSADTDGDGLTDSYEALVSHTDPLSADTDKDHLSDAYELATGTDPGHLPGIAAVSGAGPFAENIRHGVVDTDKDGLSDHTEHLIGTDASSADTDGDGLPDAMEASLGTDPTRLDSDHDGLSDGIELRYHTDPLHSGTFGSDFGSGSQVGDNAGTDPAAAGPGINAAMHYGVGGSGGLDALDHG